MSNLKTDKDINDISNKENSPKEIKEDESISRLSRKFVHNKRKYRNKDKISNKKLKTIQNSKTKNKNIYTKRTDLIQERIKILQLAKKNIEDEEEANQKSENNNNSKNILEDNEKEKVNDRRNETYKKSRDNNEQNEILFKTLKTEGFNEDNLIKKYMISDKYIKKIPTKLLTTSSDNKKPKFFRKYLTSTYFYKKEPKIDNLKKKFNINHYNNNTYTNKKELDKNETQNNNNSNIRNHSINDIEVIGYKTGFIYKNKKPKDISDFNLKVESPKISKTTKELFDVNVNIMNRQKPTKTFHKKNYSINQLSIKYKNIKELKSEYSSEKNELSSVNKGKELNKIYVPKKIPHLARGSSQGNMHTMNNNVAKSNMTTKNRYKSYKSVNNITNKNNNINININNNIKIITYNKKKKCWKMDKKDNIIEISDDKIEDDKFDIFKDNISDISSIESRSNVESETTENNNKLNVYLNNIYKTKSIFHPKLYKKKQNNTVTDKNEKEKEKEKDKDRDVLVRKNSFVIEKLKKNGGHDTNEKNEPNKNSRNVSVPHFIFKKRITKDGSEFKHKSKSKNNNTNINNDNTINKNYLNNQTNIKIIKNENEPRFDELVVIEFKLEKIIRGIDRNSSILNNLCFDFLNYFNESSISSMIEKLFDNKNLKIITISLKYLVFSIIFLYNNCSDLSFDENDKFLIQEIFSLNLQSILYLYEYIISKLKSKNKWANDIKNIIHNYKKLKKKIYSSNTNLYYQSVFDKIKNNSKYIRQITNRIFVSNKNTSDIILSFFKELEKKDFSEIKNFYITNIYKENSIYGYLYPFSLTDNNDNNNNDFIHEKLIYNNKKNTKKFTLFLGLEDILINYKLDNESELKGTLILRPGLIPFLREIHKFFEIIIFSLSKKQLADYLINSIDKKNQFFDYRLFRENFSIVNDEFIIDLSQINIPLSKILIISNIPQIYKLYKDNGIYLQSYWEENLKDKVLGQLMSILKNIANENGDIREILVNYRDNLVNQLILQ